MSYQSMIAAVLEQIHEGRVQARHVEAWMRVEHATLDALPMREFATEVRTAVACALAEPADVSERLARAVGL